MLRKLDYQSTEQLEEKVKRYKRGYVVSAITMFSSLTLIFGSEFLPQSPPTIKTYEKIQISVSQLENKLTYLNQNPSLNQDNDRQTDSLKESLENYKDNLSQAIKGLKKDANEIKDTLEYKEFNLKRNLQTLIPFTLYLSSLPFLLFYALSIGKKEDELNERKKKDNNINEKYINEEYKIYDLSPDEKSRVIELRKYSDERDKLCNEYQEMMNERINLGIPTEGFYEELGDNIARIMKKYNIIPIDYEQNNEDELVEQNKPIVKQKSEPVINPKGEPEVIEKEKISSSI